MLIFFSFTTETFSFFEHDIIKNNIIRIFKFFIIFIFKLLTDKFKSLSVYADDFNGFFNINECGMFFSFNSMTEKLLLLLNNSLKPLLVTL